MSDFDYQVALDEVGPIEPWWSNEDQLFIFEHDAYPMVMHGDQTPELTIAGYHRALRTFVEARVAGQVSSSVDRITSGRGGVRPGAGRPVGSGKTAKTLAIKVLEPLALQLKGNPALQVKILDWLESQKTV